MVDRTSPEFRSYLELYERAPLLELGRLADDVRWKLHPENVVTYIIVTDVRRPRRWAISITSSHRSAPAFLRAT